MFDLATDPHQEHPLRDPDLELHLATLLVEQMRANDAPPDQFERLGLPVSGAVGAEHLVIDAQWEQSQRALGRAARRDDFAADAPINTLRLSDALADERLRAALGDVPARMTQMARFMPTATLIEVLAMRPDVSADEAHALNAALVEVLAPASVGGISA